jgi:hypothetical protein
MFPHLTNCLLMPINNHCTSDVTTDRWYDKQCNKKEQLIALCGLAQQVKF